MSMTGATDAMNMTGATDAMNMTGATGAMGAMNTAGMTDAAGVTNARGVSVLVVDDQELVRSGFSTILNAQADIEVVGEAANGLEAINMAKALKPDVVLMDIRMPLLDGLEATEELRKICPQTQVLILTTFDLDEYVYRALKLGAAGFLLKDVDPKELIEAVHVVARDDALLSPAVTRRLIERFAVGELGEVGISSAGTTATAQWILDSLTSRELEILQMIARGLSNDEIANELYISVATAKTHVNRIMGKLDVHDRAALVVLAYENRLT